MRVLSRVLASSEDEESDSEITSCLSSPVCTHWFFTVVGKALVLCVGSFKERGLEGGQGRAMINVRPR
jgi:hypothetical protein